MSYINNVYMSVITIKRASSSIDKILDMKYEL